MGLNTMRCMCCGKFFPLRNIRRTPGVPVICVDCAKKIEEAYGWYLKDDALDELEILLKHFNTLTDVAMSIEDMRSIYEGMVCPLVEPKQEELNIDNHTVDSIQPTPTLRNNTDKKVSNIKNIEPYSVAPIQTQCTASDYYAIAIEAVNLMREHKYRHTETAILMAWRTVATKKLQGLSSGASSILMEKPDVKKMSKVVNDILDSGEIRVYW